jgi:hypothetical protein
MLDTSVAAENRYYELLRAKEPFERLAIAVRLTLAVRSLAAAAVRERHPAATPEELEHHLIERLYGSAVASRLRSAPRDHER